MIRKTGLLTAALIASAAVSACAPGPRYVKTITGGQDSMKFVYVQAIPKFLGEELVTGVVRCEVSAKGALGKCKDMPIEFKEQ